MSLTISDPIPLSSQGRQTTLRVVTDEQEGRVVLVLKVHGIVSSLDLDLAAARTLRAALPAPSRPLHATRS